MRWILFLTILLLFQDCSLSKKKETAMKKQPSKIELDYSTGPPTVIYKTKKDYSSNVAVSLSDDKSKIISFPDPSDVFYNGKLAYPTQLNNGYLLDNMGINTNVAFLSITLEQYQGYKEIPSIEQLYQLIIDKDPLLEFYNCGNRHSLQNEVKDLNNLINNSHLPKCKCLKKT